ncbi:MAG TPA: hypothetical protein PLF52_01685, partial [Syntrophales bacterium]|nr:hypothetical protein [Syntrophales bacterium]
MNAEARGRIWESHRDVKARIDIVNIALIKFSTRGREKVHKNYGHQRLKPAVRSRFGRRRDGEANDVLGKRYRDDQQGQFGG